ncbi:MAG: DUF1634 domain-containing protein [Terracidiphilus sp.]
MDDHRLETIIGQLLRVGVLLAAATVLLGGVLYLAGHHAERVNYQAFAVGGPGICTFPGIVRSAAHFESLGIIQFGLLILIATPVARVGLALAGFALERDRLYTVVSVIVLLILLASLMHAT